MSTVNLNVPGMKYKVPVTITEEKGRLVLNFKYCPALLAEVKAMEGAKWHGFDLPPRKVWSVAKSSRNLFTFEWLMGNNVFAEYDKPLVEVDLSKYEGVYPHQVEMVSHGLTRRRCIWSCEMGTGKTLAAIILMELSGFREWWWIGTRSSLRAVEYEFRKWKAKVIPTFYSYDSLKKVVEGWESGKKAPRGIIFDESSRLKTPTAQRSLAAKAISESMEKDWGKDAFVILMSGSPAPKDPCDWWMQGEVAKPGFIREGNIFKFKQRMCVMREQNGLNGIYKELVTWLDDERKCKKCGKFKEDPGHETSVFGVGEEAHTFVPSINEVQHLYKRLNGLVLVKFKKDVLKFLPEKRYETITLTPTSSIIRTAKTLARTAKNVITGLTLLRELSDGFQYIEKVVGQETCPRCAGSTLVEEYFDPKDPERRLFDVQNVEGLEKRKIKCDTCNGTAKVNIYERTVQEVPCPKEDALVDLLDAHEDAGRIVIYGGFTGSVDRVVTICHKEGWATIRVDGRGWSATEYNGDPIDCSDLVTLFQDRKNDYPRVAFVGQPGAAGMGLTLTASPGIVYWSNDFNAESRIQSEDRIHRPGMDLNRGATIYDLIHLPTDLHILNNLKKKRDLQAMTMGDFSAIVDTIEERVV